MSITIITHIMDEEAIVGETDKLPEPADQVILITNPRRRDGKDLHYLEDDTSTMIIPWHRISFIEVVPTDSELEEVITFVRE